MSIATSLEEARRALLDLSTRNRMLSLPAPGRARGLLHVGRPAGAADEAEAPAGQGAEPPAGREDPAFVLAQLAAGRAFTFEATRRGDGKRRAEGVALADAKDASSRAMPARPARKAAWPAFSSPSAPWSGAIRARRRRRAWPRSPSCPCCWSGRA
jgi:hypothetical protein